MLTDTDQLAKVNISKNSVSEFRWRSGIGGIVPPLKLIQDLIWDEVDRARSYIYSVYVLDRLRAPRAGGVAGMPDVDGVRAWARAVPIFEKDYLFIPVNTE